MTYSFNTLNSSRTEAGAVRTGIGRFIGELSLLASLLLLLFWLLALLTYATQDAAWSTSGNGTAVLNRAGAWGAWLADSSYFLFGFSAWWAVVAAVWAWWGSLARWLRERALLMRRPQAAVLPTSFLSRLTSGRLAFWCGLVLLLCASSLLEWSVFYSYEIYLPGSSGGVLGYLLGSWSLTRLGFTGAALLAIGLGIIGLALLFGFSWARVAERLGRGLYSLLESQLEKRVVAQDMAMGQQAARERENLVENPFSRVKIEPIQRDASQKSEPLIETADEPPSAPTLSEQQLHWLGLLDSAAVLQDAMASETLEMTCRMIEKKLSDLGVEVQVILARPGPVITRYEVEPEPGVASGQLIELAKELARSLSLGPIRVQQGTPDAEHQMTLELPNSKRQSIKLVELLSGAVYNQADSVLTLALGKDVAGESVLVDLAKAPHLLVVGGAGSGKPMSIHALILSLLYKATPRDVRLLLLDSKTLELSVYEDLAHLLAPVVSDVAQAAHGLTWCVAEMERRYKLLTAQGVRNLKGYNAKIDQTGAAQHLPHLVVFINELADLMSVRGEQIEELIIRLAQRGRDAGIHLILATQRPSTEVVTGLIKANFPARMVLQVGSKTDSLTLLEHSGAEVLLGMGDMLYRASNSTRPLRVHGPFVNDDEVRRVVRYLKTQAPPDYVAGVLESIVEDEPEAEAATVLPAATHAPHETAPLAALMPVPTPAVIATSTDPLYEQAVAVVLQHRNASTKMLQRSLKIGYSRAEQLIHDMEQAGLLGPLNGHGERDILAPA